jgi:cytochrome c oxidase subunit IV
MADHSSHSSDSHDEHDAHAGHGSGTLYLMVFVALCILTAISFGSFYAFHSMPKVGWAVMMAVSCMKAGLVILFFMHLIWEANWKYVLTFPAMFMSLFLVFMLVPDVGWRMDNYNYYRTLYAAEPQAEVEYEAGIVDHEAAAAEAAKKAEEHQESEPAAHTPAH